MGTRHICQPCISRSGNGDVDQCPCIYPCRTLPYVELQTHISFLEHVVNQDAQAADRHKVPAEVIQVASHEVDTDSDKDESIVTTSGSEGSESASESEQNDPPSSLASDAEQYERLLFIWPRKWLLSCTPSATQEIETSCFWHQIYRLDWRYLLCGHSAGGFTAHRAPVVRTSCNTRRMSTELPIHLGWTRRWLRRTLRRSRLYSSCFGLLGRG